MIDRPDDEELQRLIAGDSRDSLDPDDAADLELLTELLGDESTWAEPSAGLEDAVVRAVAAAPAAADQPRTSQQARSRRARSTRWRVGSAAAAVAAMLAVGTIVATTQGGTSAAFTAELAPTQLLPGAHAAANVSQNQGGFRVELDVRGLPLRPAGEFYEAWLKNDAGTLVPIGTFSSSDTHVTLWSGVSPAEFPHLTVTIEAADNNQASSGQVVLAGVVEPKP